MLLTISFTAADWEAIQSTIDENPAIKKKRLCDFTRHQIDKLFKDTTIEEIPKEPLVSKSFRVRNPELANKIKSASRKRGINPSNLITREVFIKLVHK